MNLAVKNNSLSKNEKGFSLLEVIFAMAIITSGIISILSLFTYNLKAEINNKNKLIATYLAQEAIEVVRQIRDNIWFGGDIAFLDNAEFADDEVIIALIDGDNTVNDIRKGWEIVATNSAAKRRVYFFNNSYVQRDGNFGPFLTQSGFSRYLEIDNGSDGSRPAGCDIDSCVRIISHVSFSGVELAKATAYLYDDWY